jgi:glycosyltransferase involved in cell wall biosynthesis
LLAKAPTKPLPHSIVKHKKADFGIPVDTWLPEVPSTTKTRPVVRVAIFVARWALPVKLMKPRVLITTNVYLPGYLAGGTVRSIAGLVESLGDEFEMLVVTSDRDAKASSPYTDVHLDAWNRVGKAHVHYMRRRSQTIRGMARLLRETPHDLLYLNSFFHPRFSIIPMTVMRLGLAPKCPVLIAPRGEFSIGAYRLKSFKKRLFTGISRILSLHRGVRWHASTDQDADNIRRVLGVPDAQITVARDLVAPRRAVTGSARNARPNEGPLRVCFLSRIMRVKNLDYALRVLTQVKIPVLFSIYGPKEDPAYWHECERLISAMPSHVEVRYEGSIANEQVQQTIARHDVFFLPTRGENFGHVFLEAWSAGVPILISDQTPWKQLKEKGIGWDLALEDERQYVSVLAALAKLSRDAYEEFGVRCREYAARHVNDHAAIAATRRMLLKAFDVHGKEQA